MTRPTILDLDLVVVPREATDEMAQAGEREIDECENAFGAASAAHVFPAMLSASPYPTAWDDVRKYVEGLEAGHKAVSDFVRVRIPDDQNKDQADCYLAHIGLICRLEERAEVAEARIAELEKRLADAERVIEPFARLGTMSTHSINEDGTASFSFFRTADMSAFTDARRAARAYMEGK